MPWRLTTNPPSSCANSLMVPRRLRLVRCREGSGCPTNGSKINGLDLASTAFSSPSVNRVPNPPALSTFAGNLDCEPNQRLKNVGIMICYLAENTLKHPSTPRLEYRPKI